MASDVRRRVELVEDLAPTVGRETAVRLLDEIPMVPGEVATRTDLDALERRMDDRFAVVDHRFTALEQHINDRFAVVDHRFTALEQHIDDRFAALDERFVSLRHELLAAFRGELVTAVSGQTRQVIVATATAVFGIGGLAVTLAQVL